GLQVRGGSETLRYFLHGEWEDEDGITKVPEFEKRYMAANGLSLNSNQRNPNGLTRITTRANINIVPTDNLDVAVSAGYISSDMQLERREVSCTSDVAANIYGGPGFKYNTNAAGDTLWGWREYTPRRVYQTETSQAIERFITSASTNFRPTDWLSFRANAGL